MQTKLGTYTSRKIEQRMCAAVADIYNWHEDNTEVRVGLNEATGQTCARVYLHGNHIATLTQVRHDKLELNVIRSTLHDWPTNTTISRLRALGADIRLDRRNVYLNGEYVTTR